MSKGIYSLKIFLFREEFRLTKKEYDGIRDICIFIKLLYVKIWFSSTNAITAPNQDLNFIKSVMKYSEIDLSVSNAVLRKLTKHLWYLAEENVALSFFDAEVTILEKQRMVENLNLQEPIIKLKQSREIQNIQSISEACLSDFVSHRTKNLFSVFGLAFDFLQEHPTSWEANDDYQESLLYCSKLFSVNDTAERGVKFMKEYNRILTNNETEKQLLLQIVESYNKKYPNSNKSNLL